MIKGIFCVRRKEDQTRESFREYWENEHKPLLVELAKKSEAKKMVISFSLAVKANVDLMIKRETEMPFDAVIEFWWENKNPIEAFMESEVGQALMQQTKEVADKYLDAHHSSLFFADETELI